MPMSENLDRIDNFMKTSYKSSLKKKNRLPKIDYSFLLEKLNLFI
jgi:hypothetical protein